MESKKVLVAEVIHTNGFIPVSLLFSFLQKVLSLFRWIPFEATYASKPTYRLISPNSFFTEDFLDVSFRQKPEINQVFRIQGIEGKWVLIRKNTREELAEEVIRKEILLNKGDICSIDRLLEEDYPHLMVNKEENQEEIEILEVLELD